MSASSRAKGVTGEREVAKVYQAAGLEVRGLEASGDHLVVCAGGLTLHSESKWHARRVRWPEWMKQAEAEAPQGTVPVVAWRQDNGTWYASLRLEDFAVIVAARS